MIPEIPDRYWRVVGVTMIIVSILTFFSMIIDMKEKEEQLEYTLKVEMAKRNFCLRAITGSSILQYQPCNCKITVER